MGFKVWVKLGLSRLTYPNLAGMALGWARQN